MSLRRELELLFARRHKRERSLAPRRVLGRNRDGTEQHQRLDAECELRAGQGSHAVGQVTLSPAAPPFRDPGAAGVAGLGSSGSGGLVWIEEQDPAELPQGFEGLVTLSGRGLSAAIHLEHRLLEDSAIAHPGITLNDVTAIDSLTLELDVTVAQDAELVDEAPLAYGLTSPPSRLRPALYSVVPPIAEPAYLAYIDDDGTLILAVYTSDGSYIEDTGTVGYSTAEGLVAIAQDPADLVNPGSLVYMENEGSGNGYTSALVHDFVADLTYRHDATAGWVMTAALPVSTWLYWVEYLDGPSTETLDLQLHRAKPDLTLHETIGSTITIGTGSDSDGWLQSNLSAITDTHYLLRPFGHFSFEVIFGRRVRVDLATGLATEHAQSLDQSVRGSIGLSTGTSSLAVGNAGSGMQHWDGQATSDWASWVPGTWPTVAPTTVQVASGQAVIWDGIDVRTSSAVNPPIQPTAQATLEPHPSGGDILAVTLVSTSP